MGTRKNCKKCGKFTTRTKYCCDKCKFAFHNNNKSEKKKAEVSTLTKTCRHCKQDFTPTYSPNWSRQCFCCDSCRVKFYVDRRPAIYKRVYKQIEVLKNRFGTKLEAIPYEPLGYSAKDMLDRFGDAYSDEKELDHIFPISAFLKRGITDLAIINRLDNLQPLTRKENRSKASKYDKAAFEAFLAV